MTFSTIIIGLESRISFVLACRMSLLGFWVSSTSRNQTCHQLWNRFQNDSTDTFCSPFDNSHPSDIFDDTRPTPTDTKNCQFMQFMLSDMRFVSF